MKKTCGIYRIMVRRPNFSPKYYIGQSIHIVARRATHFRDLRRGSHKNEMLQRAFAKYGEKAFSFEILLVCQRTKETLSMYEQAVLDSYAADELYNICKMCVDSVLGVKRSQETALKMLSVWTGRKHTDEARRNISAGRSGWKPSAEHVEHLRRIAREKEPVPRAHLEMLAEMKRGTSKSAAEIAQRTATRRANAAAKGRSY